MSRSVPHITSEHHDGTWSPASFAQATDIRDVVRLQHSLRRRVIVMRVFVVILAIAALVIGLTPVVLQWKTSTGLARQSTSIQHTVAGWPYPRAEESLREARAYNAKLAASDQPVLGEAVDPFSSATGSSQTSDAETSASSNDAQYQRLLNVGDGVMGSIKIPKIGVDLPIRHGTSNTALEQGAGHLYGTSLPVGGTSTHSVITGHRGMVNAAMFTRLDEMRLGDAFYIDVMGDELAYQVDDIAVIEPNDTSKLRIVPGEDRVTLMTCTPYGINTQRLLVSAHRVDVPHDVPYSADVHDARTIGIAVALIVLVLGLVCCVIRGRHQFGRIHMRHAHHPL